MKHHVTLVLGCVLALRGDVSDLEADVDGATMQEGALAPLRFTAADLRDLHAFRETGRKEAR